MTTEDPKMAEKSAAMSANMTDSEGSSDEEDSMEFGEDETEDPDSEFIMFTRPFTLITLKPIV